MRAGELNKRVELKKPVKTVASFGDTQVTYTTVDTVWAAVEWGSGRRYNQAATLNSDVQGVIRIRFRTDVKANWRVALGSREIEILSLSNYRERNEELWITCWEAKD